MRKKIDKSKLTFGTRPKVVDEAYRKSYKDSTCCASSNGVDLCGNPAVGAHCRTGELAGIGTKPSDDLTFPLCHECHADQERNIGAGWWLENVLKPQMRRRYREWKSK